MKRGITVAEEKSGEGGRAKDLSQLIEQTTNILQEMDRHLQTMRTDLSSLMGRGLLPPGPAGLGLFAPPPLGAEAPPAFATGPSPMMLGFGVGPYGLSPTEASGVRPWGASAWGSGAGSGSVGGDGLPSAKELKSMPPTSRVPNVDFFDENTEFLIKVDLPGVKKEQVEIVCSGRMVTVKGESKSDVEEGSVLLSERGSVAYRRVIPLPAEVHSTQTKASLKDGILTLRMPKKAPGEAPRRIDVAYG